MATCRYNLKKAYVNAAKRLSVRAERPRIEVETLKTESLGGEL